MYGFSFSEIGLFIAVLLWFVGLNIDIFVLQKRTLKYRHWISYLAETNTFLLSTVMRQARDISQAQMDIMALKLKLGMPLPTSIKILLNGVEGQKMNTPDNVPVTASIGEVDDQAGTAIAGAALDASPAPVWSLDDASFGSLEVAADGQSAKFNPNGKLGLVHIQLAGSIGGAPIVGKSEDINVVNSAAATVKLNLA